MASATRSFILPVGFSLSSFSRMRAPFLDTILRKANKEVFPMQSRMFLGRLLMAPFFLLRSRRVELCQRQRGNFIASPGIAC